MAKVIRRDYSLTGPENRLAQEKGLVAAEWYSCPIPRQRMKELMMRKDWPGIRDTIIWFSALIVVGVIAYHAWGTWWAIPAFALYGILYATPADSRWHECSHGTPFKTAWINEVVYQIVSFMIFRPATPWRWSHVRHHTDTTIVGRDPEFISERPPVWRIFFAEFFRLYLGQRDIKRLFLHCFGKLDEEEKDYMPASAARKSFWEARINVLLILALVASCVYMHSILPAMFVGLPAFYGTFFVITFIVCQHLGLAEDVLDHRLNSRTWYMNRIYRFLWWNMNYHIEHHMFPMVPYHALPALHEEIKADCPPACPSHWTALKEVIPAIIRQRKDPTYTIVRQLPCNARPYYFGPHPFGIGPQDVAAVQGAKSM